MRNQELAGKNSWVGIAGRLLGRRRSRTRGVAITEMVILLIPAWLMVTLVMQIALGSLARVTVEYAARVAARAAVVWLPRESDSGSTGGDVRTAAAYPMIAISPAMDRKKVSIGEHLGQGHGLADLMAKMGYAKRATNVEMTPASPAWNDPVTVKVYYLYPCQVPLANSLVCHRFGNLPADAQGRFSGAFPGWYLYLKSQHTLTNQGRP